MPERGRTIRIALLQWAASLALCLVAGLIAELHPPVLLRLLLGCALGGLPLWFVVAWLLQSAAPGRPPPGPPEVASAPQARTADAARREQRLQREQQLLAERDPLTGCLNRRALLERLGGLLAAPGAAVAPPVCALVEIDEYAVLGARFGQETGERMLGILAQVVRDNLRDADLLARWSGPAFCVVMPGVAADGAALVCERVRRAVMEAADARFTTGTRVTVSAGIAALPDGERDAQRVVDGAERALAEARAAGGNRVAVWSAAAGAEVRSAAPVASSHESTAARVLDPLTGLPGADEFRECVAQGVREAVRKQRTAAVVLVDASLSAEAPEADPEEIRLQLSLRLRNALRGIDAVALADDAMAGAGRRPRRVAAFGLLVNDLPDPRMAANIVRRVCAQIAEPVETGGAAIGALIGAGVALAPADAVEPKALLAAAAVAMGAACERSGRINCEFVAADMNQVYVDQERFRAELQQALAGEELELHYLPRLSMTGDRVSAVEALVRWNHPQRGLLLPAQFIPTAETAGMIVALGNWVIARAIAQASAWRQLGHDDLVVCVNLSPFQLRQLNLAELTAELLERHELEARHLEIEISEASVIGNTEAAVALIRRLNASGVRIAIDDFGTGYAMLKYLRRFPADTVKIDRSLVTEVHRDNRDATIVSAIVSLADSLGIDTVAEGVETEAQRTALLGLGCRSAQGYLFSRPLRAADVPAFLSAGRAS